VKNLYKPSLALLTDLYELTMAYGYWKKGMAKRHAAFHLFFRRRPFGGPFAICAGLSDAIDFVKALRFDASDLSFLEQLKAENGRALFDKAFLDYLSTFSFTGDLEAVPEGTPIFPYEPMVQVKGPIIEAQLLESALLNIINFQSLIATKAARICWAARPDSVVEFGLRRAQGIDGAISASRAAFIGGCHATSHVLAGKLFGIPVRGTQAHSWVMAFQDEEEAFRAWGEVMPHNALFLVDTYDSIEGTKRAIRVAKALKEQGVRLLGVRLDSGDLAELSIAIRKLLDEAGFTQAQIMASNELDEGIISDLKHQGAQIAIWGVGTHLVTGKEQPALDGVYKLAAIQNEQGKWDYKLKTSEQLAKVTNPGILQVRRFFDQRGNIADMIFDQLNPPQSGGLIIDSLDPSRQMQIKPDVEWKDLLVPILKMGKEVSSAPSLEEMRQKTYDELERFHPSIRRFLYPQLYFTGLEKSLYEKKLSLIANLRSK
jgi:nicotinate phosphoribosyltransferase